VFSRHLNSELNCVFFTTHKEFVSNQLFGVPAGTSHNFEAKLGSIGSKYGKMHFPK